MRRTARDAGEHLRERRIERSRALARLSTSPMRSASRPSKRCAVSDRRRVRDTPMRCATNGAICAGGTPSVVSEIENFASAVASTTSPPHIRPSPPPYAAPSTTITIVCGSSSKRAMI